MAFLVPSYEYDIFISYRHNDNRSGWVTEFVKNLQEELSATIKEPVSVYFDINSYDGLLETHNVDKSLEGKLKCLIFIPIISQTYCDPKSFAWQHEFVAFNKMMSQDPFGRDIRLSNGNVASRILPIQIHDLDGDDKMLLEKELGCVLRSIEFIYKSTGVNRPLTPSDNPDKNHNKSFYRDQTNKVANAIKEIVSALRNTGTQSVTSPQKIFNHSDASDSRKSIAVLPFVNMSNDPQQEYFSDGITEEILNALAHIRNLKVAGRTSSFQFKGRNPDLREIGDKLGVGTVLEGSVRKQGDRIRITAQLINVQDGFHLWSERFDRNMDDIFAIQDEIAFAIAEKLKITLLDSEKAAIETNPTTSKEAYENYLKGRYFIERRAMLDARRCYELAIESDSQFALAYAGLADTFCLISIYGIMRSKEVLELAEQAATKALELNGSLSEAHGALALVKTIYHWDWHGAEKYFLTAINLNPDSAHTRQRYALYFLTWVKGDFEKAMGVIRKAIALEPWNFTCQFTEAYILVYQKKYNAAVISAQKAVQLAPDSFNSYRILGLSQFGKGEIENAISSILKAMTLSNRHHFCMLELSIVYAKMGRTDECRELLKELIDRSSHRYVPDVFIGIIAYLSGEQQLGREYYTKAMQNRDGSLIGNFRYPFASEMINEDDFFKQLRSEMKFPE